LAIKYYGSEEGKNNLLANNPFLKDIHSHKSLEIGTKVLII
jgi:hypothetical protein